MPSIRVLFVFVYARLVGSPGEHTTFVNSDHVPTGVRLNQDTSAGIHRSKSYSVEYDNQHSRDASRFVRLVDIEGSASSKNDISVVERMKQDVTRAYVG